MAICSNCGNETLEGAVFCDQCGTPVPAAESAAAPEAAPAGGSVICGACGAGNVPGEAFCDFCGSPLEAPVPSAEAVVELEAASTEAEVQISAAAEGKPACPACGAEVLADEAFCATCGASLAESPIPPDSVPEVGAELEVEEVPAEAEAEVVAEAIPEPAPVEDAEAEVEDAPAPVEESAVEDAPELVVEAEPEPEPEEPPAPAPDEVPAPVPDNTCSVCGAEVEPGDKFCSNCGAPQAVAPAPLHAAVPAPAPEAEPEPAPTAAPTAAPRLVVTASGAEIPLPAAGEILIGREDPVSGIFPEVDLTPHEGESGGVSRRHAKIVVDGGSYFVEDLDSTNYTFVNKQKLGPGARQALNDGDELRCGRVALVLKTT